MDGRNRTIYLGTVMIAFGVLSLFRKRLYIWRSLNSFFKTQDDSPEIELTVDDNGVGIESAHTSGRMDWKGLVDFKEVTTGILLYPQTNIFYWVPATAKIEGGDLVRDAPEDRETRFSEGVSAPLQGESVIQPL